MLKLFLVSVSAYTDGVAVRQLLGTPTDDGTGRCSTCSHVFDKNDPKCYCVPPGGMAPTLQPPKWYHGVGWTFGESWELVKSEVMRQVLENQLPTMAGWKNHKVQGLMVPDEVIHQAHHELTAATDIMIGDPNATIESPDLHEINTPEQTLIPEGVSETIKAADSAAGLILRSAEDAWSSPGNAELLTPGNG